MLDSCFVELCCYCHAGSPACHNKCKMDDGVYCLYINIWHLFVAQARISQLAIFGAIFFPLAVMCWWACVAEFHKRKIAVTPYVKAWKQRFLIPLAKICSSLLLCHSSKERCVQDIGFYARNCICYQNHLCLMIVTDSLGVIIWQNGSRVKYSGWGSVFSTQPWASDSSVFLVQLLALLVLSRECVRLSYYVNILTSNYITSVHIKNV